MTEKIEGILKCGVETNSESTSKLCQERSTKEILNCILSAFLSRYHLWGYKCFRHYILKSENHLYNLESHRSMCIENN